MSEEAKSQFLQLKTKRSFKWLTFRLDPDSFEIKVDKSGDAKSTQEDFLSALPLSEARFAVFDHEVRCGRGDARLYGPR